MQLLKETIFTFITIVGFVAAMVLYYLCFVALGEAVGVVWIGNLAYALVTVLAISFFAAKDKIAHQKKLKELEEKYQESTV